MKWIISDLIPEGLVLFAGKQKMGKSFMAFQISLNISTGGYVLEKFQVEQSGALYLALEDGERRIYERGKVMAKGVYPTTLHIAYGIADIRNGGLDDLKWYLDDHPHTKLVIFDIISRAMSLNPKADPRDEVYKALSPLQRLATERRIGIIAVHHLNQQSSEGKLEDELDGVYGSGGYTQVADTVMMLKRRRGSNTATLYITGRDIEEHEYHLQWWPELLSWAVTGDDTEQAISNAPYEMGRFIEAIEKLGSTTRRKDLAKELGKDENVIDQAIRRAKEAGRLTPDSGSGHFHLTTPSLPSVA